MSTALGRRITASRVAIVALVVCLIAGAAVAQWAAQTATDRNNQVWNWSGEPSAEVLLQINVQQYLWAIVTPMAGTLAIASAFGLLVVGSRPLAVRWSHWAAERAAQHAADHAADVADTLRPIRPPAR
ncbi:hypothetical protein [Agromyces larvae]|uniref:Uncharacterized protein n=1 Tax=Agromyces larvae TaxID=2929802 RepID=A0ABY4C177_9MICO|nr:hypothetical protein [Agromyces larvae]UOE43708.1 hypothetical protein MTO99_16270 [Agromyces larvae]